MILIYTSLPRREEVVSIMIRISLLPHYKTVSYTTLHKNY
jgi:hypothetical protein